MEFRTIKNRMVSSGILLEEEGQLSFFNDEKPKKKKEVKYRLITEKELDTFLAKLKPVKVLCVDTETSSLNIQEAELAGVALSFKENEGYYIPTIENEESIINKIKPFLENPEVKIIGHNLKYDIQVLRKFGIYISGNVFDTMLAHYLINPESSHSQMFCLKII